MDEFRWIQMFLCLMLMNMIAVSVNETFIFMKVGEDVTLPCLNVTDDQNNCDGTTWTFASRNKPTVELITLGQIGEEAKTQSDRLSVTANCSLDIKKLTVEDVGRYYCVQYKVEQTPHTLVHQSQVLLSVIILTEHKDTNKVTLNCSVLTYEECHHTVKWLLKGRHVDKDNNQMMTSQTGCSTPVTFLESHYLYSSSSNTVKCEVTDTNTGRVQLFTFSPQPSGEETGDTKTTKKPTESTKSETTTTTTDDPSDWKDIHWYIIAAVGSVSLLIIVVIFVSWKRNKGKKTQMDGAVGLSLNPAAPQTSQDLVDPEVSYATISFTKTTRRARVRGDDEGDAVPYSTVRAPSSSAAAAADPTNLDSTVSFPVL